MGGVPAVPTGHKQDTCSIGDQWEHTEKSFLKNNGTTGEDIQRRPEAQPSLVERFSDRGSAVLGGLPDHLTGHNSTALASLCLSKPEEKAEKTI